MDRLKQLTPLTPDTDRSERVRVKCRRRLQRNNRRGFAPAIIGVVFLLYTAAFVFTTLRLEGLIQ